LNRQSYPRGSGIPKVPVHLARLFGGVLYKQT